MSLSTAIVRHRLSLAFSLMVAISLVAGLVAHQAVGDIQRNLDEIVQNNNAKLRLLHQMAEAVHVVSGEVPNLLLRDTADTAAIETGALKIAQARQRYDQAWATLQGLRAGAPSQILRANILAASQRARTLNEQVVALARSGQDREATSLLRAQAGPAVQQWQDALNVKIVREEADNTRAYAAALSEFSQARALLLGVNGLNVAMGIFFGVLMVRQRRQDKLSQHALRQAKDAAQQATEAKSAFLANMSHEIRTPMNGVLGVAELLGSTALDEVQRKYVKTIRRSGRSLMALLNDILDLSKVESGRLKLERRHIDLRRVLQASIDLMSPLASQKGLLLALDITDDLDTWVTCDPLRLQQVINNLLSNAVKFTDTGQVRLSLAPERAAGKPGYRFCVRDSGPGIAASALDKLFEPFYQGDGSTTREYGGTGLGLTIASRMVQAMGGMLRVESTLGVGSSFAFTVSLPAAPRHLQHLDDEQSGFSGFADFETARGAAMTVLLVEDDAVNQLYGRAVLEQMGHDVQSAKDGLEAVRMAGKRRFDLVLMDCDMPRLDGFEATRRIRLAELDRGAPRTPIVALTATAMAEDRQRSLDAGMDDLLTKPYSREDMARLIGQVVGTSSRIDTEPLGR